MDKYIETFETWNKVASLYEENFMNLEIYNESYDLFCNTVNTPNASILEIGCGPGNITKYLSKKRSDFKIHATDIAYNMIELAKKNNPSVEFSIMDCRNITHLNKRFDGIICGFCIPYISELETGKLICDSASLLNHNGIIYISFVDGNPEQSGYKAASTGDRSYFYYHQTTNILAALKVNQFSQIKKMLVEFERPNRETEIHTIIIAKK